MLLAAGGQETEIHLSLHGPSPPDESQHRRHRRGTKALWRFEGALTGASILNSVLLTSMNLTRSNESSFEPRVVISNNDETVKFYDVPVKGDMRPNSIKEAGILKLGTPVNHCSYTTSKVRDDVLMSAYSISIPGRSDVVIGRRLDAGVPPSYIGWLTPFIHTDHYSRHPSRGPIITILYY